MGPPIQPVFFGSCLLAGEFAGSTHRHWATGGGASVQVKTRSSQMGKETVLLSRQGWAILNDSNAHRFSRFSRPELAAWLVIGSRKWITLD